MRRNELAWEIAAEAGVKKPAIVARLRKYRAGEIDCDGLYAPLESVKARRRKDRVAGFGVTAIAETLGMTRAGVRYRILQCIAGVMPQEEVTLPKHHLPRRARPEGWVRPQRPRWRDGKPGCGNDEWRSLSDKPRSIDDEEEEVWQQD